MERISDEAEEDLIRQEERARVIKTLEPLEALVTLLLLDGVSIENIAAGLGESVKTIKAISRKRK